MVWSAIIFLLLSILTLLLAILVTDKSVATNLSPSPTVVSSSTPTPTPASSTQLVYDTFDEAGVGVVSLSTHTSNLGVIWNDFLPYIPFDLYQGQGYVTGPDSSLIANQIAIQNYTPLTDNIKITYTYLTPTVATGHIVTIFGILNANGDGVVFEIFYNENVGNYGLQILNITGFVPDVGSPVSNVVNPGVPTLNTQLSAIVTMTASGDITFDADSMNLTTSAILHTPNSTVPDLNTFFISDSYQAPGGFNMYQIFEVLVEKTN